VGVIYLDTSAMIKRVIDERESDALEEFLRDANRAGSSLMSSVLGSVEAARALRARAEQAELEFNGDDLDLALGGVRMIPLEGEVVTRAQSIGPPLLRSLDAVHCASAIEVASDQLVTYDRRLATAATRNGLDVISPGARA
jgi:predicted nucleic acid-binding protein